MDVKKHNQLQKRLQGMPSRVISFFRERINLFIVSAFAPLILILYYAFAKRGDVVTWMVPFYGFLLLYMKKDKLSDFSQASPAFRVAGLTVTAFSFLAYYVVVRFYPPAPFYGVANYTLHLAGLFLFFFEPRALKEAFSPLFLIGGAASIAFLGAGLEDLLWPAIPFFSKIVELVLRASNIPATLVGSNTFVIAPLHSSEIYLGIEPACIGIYSMVTFSILIAVTLVEESSCSHRAKLLWTLGGVLGTFLLNLVRVSFIFVVIYYFGYENWPAIHEPIGYVLFFTWVGCFLLVFSKRQAVKEAFQSLFRRSRKDSMSTGSKLDLIQ
jgi:exosortase/archaeosortase family protein